MAERIDPYAILQVQPTAHQEVVQAAYRALARLYHPDHNTAPDAARRMVELNKAWRMVGSPTKRAAYDATATMYDVGPSKRSASQAAERARRKNGGSGTRAGFGMPGSEPQASSAPRGQESSASGAASAGAGRAATSSAGAASSAAFGPGGPAPVGPPPGNPRGSILDFGRYQGWSLGEIARIDRNYLEWFKRMPIGRRFQAEIEDLLEKQIDTTGTARPIFARRSWLGRRG